jgi:hypothetical protein
MAILTVADFAQNIASPTITGSGLVRRVPFALTSTARLIRSGKIKSLNHSTTAAAEQSALTNQLLKIEEEVRPISATYHSSADLFSATTPSDSVSSVISMAVNPQDIKWSQSKRYSKRDTMQGSVFFHFTNSADQNNDILVMNFSGKTGNINTKVGPFDAMMTGANLKLKIFHDLYHLTREGVLLNNTNTGSNISTGIRNEFFISYRTVLMTMPLTLIGFFNTALEFTETAGDPFNRSWSFAFTVTDTSPSLDDLATKLSSTMVSGNLVGGIGL